MCKWEPQSVIWITPPLQKIPSVCRVAINDWAQLTSLFAQNVNKGTFMMFQVSLI